MTSLMDAKQQLSRRDLLLLLGGGATVFCGAGGLLGGYLMLSRGNDPNLLPTATPISLESANPQPNVPPPAMISRLDWGATPPNHDATYENGLYSVDNPEGWYVYDPPLTEAYQTVLIHHSVVDEGDDLSTLLEIQNAHRNDRGWADIAYHYLIGQTGLIYQGREVGVRGTHVAGFNTGSVGICLLGNFMNIAPTASQLDSARQLVRWLAGFLALTHLAGHRDFNDGTQCPGDNLVTYLDDFANASGLIHGIEGYIPPETHPEEHTANDCPCCTCTI